MSTVTVSLSTTSVTIVAGGTFSVTATPTPNPTDPSATFSYQWYKGAPPFNSSSATIITGATAATYTITSAQSSAAGTYFCHVVWTNGSGTPANDSNTVTLTVNGALAFSTQPASVSVKKGAVATFNCAVTGGLAPYTYQWSKSGTAIAGATSSSYTTPATVSGDNKATFTVVATDSQATPQSVTSNAATLTVTGGIAWWVWALIAGGIALLLIIIIIIIAVVVSNNNKKKKAAELEKEQQQPLVANQTQISEPPPTYPYSGGRPVVPPRGSFGSSRPLGSAFQAY